MACQAVVRGRSAVLPLAIMKLIIIGAISAAYCAFWLVRGLSNQRILDNMFRLINRRDEKYKMMVGAYGVGLIISACIIALGL